MLVYVKLMLHYVIVVIVCMFLHKSLHRTWLRKAARQSAKEIQPICNGHHSMYRYTHEPLASLDHLNNVNITVFSDQTIYSRWNLKPSFVSFPLHPFQLFFYPSAFFSWQGRVSPIIAAFLSSRDISFLYLVF